MRMWKIIFMIAIISALGISTALAEVEEVDHSKMSQTEHGSGQAEHEGEQTEKTEQGHHEEVAETPPNFVVLGGFAAVNLLFIIIGIYLKWFNRKGTTA